jgi:hypothetical protein
MGRKFTIEEIRNYLLSQDSMGDILYYLSEKNIIQSNIEANEIDGDEDDDDDE